MGKSLTIAGLLTAFAFAGSGCGMINNAYDWVTGDDGADEEVIVIEGGEMMEGSEMMEGETGAEMTAEGGS